MLINERTRIKKCSAESVGQGAKSYYYRNTKPSCHIEL